MDVNVSYDQHACYVQVSTSDVVRTVHLSDLVMVDLDEFGAPVGVEFVVAPRDITPAMLGRVAAAFPGLAPLMHDAPDWLLTRTVA